MPQVQWSTNLIPFGHCPDKFLSGGYRNNADIEMRIKAAATVPGLQGVELHYPSMVNEDNIDIVRSALAQTGLVCVIVTPNMSGEKMWQRGALTNGAPKVRQQALDRVKKAMDIARQLGAGKINLWPGLDGYEYTFQTDYRRMYDLLVGGVQECADYAPDVQICLEYKSKEPRARVAMATIGKILMVINRVGRDNVGATLDVGHAFMVGENPAESAMLLEQEKRLFHLHLNDTPGDWDWDMIAGTVHIYEFMELFYWLREVDYQGWYSFDQYPRQEDPVFAISSSISVLTDLWQVVKRIDRERLMVAMSDQDYEGVLPLLREALFGISNDVRMACS